MSGQEQPKAPRVSVLMTVYNAEPYLREAVESLLAQGFADWELVAVENGSTDSSPAILASYADSRIRVIPLPKNIGRTPALRMAFEQARGDYCAVLDADDAALPERFAKQVAFLDAHPETSLVGSWAEQINERGEVTGQFRPEPVTPEELHDALGWSNPFIHSSVMFRTVLARQVGGYPAEYVYAQDFALILKLEALAPVAMIPETLCRWRYITSSMSFSRQHAVTIAREELQLGQLAAKRAFIRKKSRQQVQQRVAMLQLRLGIFLVSDRKFIKGVVCFAKAVRSSPRCIWRCGLWGGVKRRLGF